MTIKVFTSIIGRPAIAGTVILTCLAHLLELFAGSISNRYATSDASHYPADLLVDRSACEIGADERS
jgi:hypothetical protein